MTRHVVISIVLALVAAHASAASPTADEIFAGMLKQAGGMGPFSELGVLAMEVSESETLSDGTSESAEYEMWIDTSTLQNFRLEVGPNVELAVHGDRAWARINGQLDRRPQVPRRVEGDIRKKVFPLLMPFSLTMEGVTRGERVFPGEIEGQATWRLPIAVEPGFFSTPSMETTWYVHASQEDLSYVAIESVPPVELRKVADEGMRMRPLVTDQVGGATLTTRMIVDGLDFSFVPNGHVRVTRVDVEVIPRFDPRLFFHPDQLEALESGDVPLEAPQEQ